MRKTTRFLVSRFAPLLALGGCLSSPDDGDGDKNTNICAPPSPFPFGEVRVNEACCHLPSGDVLVDEDYSGPPGYQGVHYDPGVIYSACFQTQLLRPSEFDEPWLGHFQCLMAQLEECETGRSESFYPNPDEPAEQLFGVESVSHGCCALVSGEIDVGDGSFGPAGYRGVNTDLVTIYRACFNTEATSPSELDDWWIRHVDHLITQLQQCGKP